MVSKLQRKKQQPQDVGIIYLTSVFFLETTYFSFLKKPTHKSVNQENKKVASGCQVNISAEEVGIFLPHSINKSCVWQTIK